MDYKLTDKTALISGSSKGIGFAIATSLAREGARVIVNGRSDKAVAEAKKQITDAVPAAKVEGFAGDLATVAATAELLQLFPSVDILVNNLGIFEPKPFDQIPGCGLAAILRGERLERRAPEPRVSARHEEEKLGAHRLHQQRKRRFKFLPK